MSLIVAELDGQKAENECAKPLVFIIDELDRCRPTFALELMERVKHLFQVPGITFVFGANKKSLMASVRSGYGDQEDEYLQKFFDLEFKLPIFPASVLAKRYINKLNYRVFLGHSVKRVFRDFKNMDDSDELYYPLMDIIGLTMRQAQRAAQMIYLFLSLSHEEGYLQSWNKAEIAACLAVLKVGKPNLYAEIAYKKLTCLEIVEKASSIFNNTDAVARFMPPQHRLSSEKIDYCHRFFNCVIYQLAEGEEKEEIRRMGVSSSDDTEFNKLYIQNRDLMILKDPMTVFFDRYEIIRALESLDCRF